MKTIAIIPARAGSKGIHNKNIINFVGKPLIAWTILQAEAATSIDAVYVSSDSDDILQIAKAYGAIPIKRPPQISTDTSQSEEAILHFIDSIKDSPETIVFLQATSPLRTPQDIDNAVKKFHADKADSLFSMSTLGNFCAWKKVDGRLRGASFDPQNRAMRQQKEPYYLENGSIYVFSAASIKKHKNRIGKKVTTYEMPSWKSFEIDFPEDLEICSHFFEKHLKAHLIPDISKDIPSREDIDLIVYDFDGVMTDNKAYVCEDGSELVKISRADGMAVREIRKLSLKQLVITGETNPVVLARCNKLELECIASCDNKKTALAKYCKVNGINLKRTVYVGNDFNDIDAMKTAGYKIAPADACEEVLSLANWVTSAEGGQGVIREIWSQLNYSPKKNESCKHSR